MFLKRLKEWESARHGADTPVATLGGEEFTVSNEGLHNKGSAVFPCNLQEVSQSMEIFKLNFECISLALGVVGFDDKVHDLPSCVFVISINSYTSSSYFDGC